MKYFQYTFLAVFLLSSFQLAAQFNLKVGYELDYLTNEENDLVVEAYNKKNAFLAASQEMPQLKFLNGVSIGVAYKTKISRVELAWRSSTRTRTAFGEMPGIPDSTDASAFEQSIRYNLSGFQLSTEFMIKKLGIGVSAGTDSFRARAKIVGTSNDKSITKQRLGSGTIFLSYSVYQSDRINLVLRPYYRWYLNDINHRPIADFLELGNLVGDLEGGSRSFGISIVFYNGRQEGIK